jgi:leucyl-tRNA synthetase
MAPRADKYDFEAVELKWQRLWREAEVEATPVASGDGHGAYISGTAPFTSGEAHMGHVRQNSIADSYARFRRRQGDPRSQHHAACRASEDFEKRVIKQRGELEEADREALAIALLQVVMLIAPAAPHMAEELWQEAGREGFACQAPWPEIGEPARDEERQPMRSGAAS